MARPLMPLNLSNFRTKIINNQMSATINIDDGSGAKKQQKG